MTDPTVTLIEPREDDRFRDLDEHKIARSLDNGRRSMAGVPPRYRDAVITEPRVRDYARALIATAREGSIRQGRSLLLLGATGSGKTHQAYGVVRALSVSGAACRWVATSAADLYARLRPRPGVDAEHEFERHAHAGLLVLDDLGAAKASEWTEEVNYRLINYRYEQQAPTLIISNVPPKQLTSVLGERVSSRLTEMADRVVLAGPDRRVNA